MSGSGYISGYAAKTEDRKEGVIMIKTFVLDTNILMSSPEAMTHGFEDNNVVITCTTLQELDAHKNDVGERGYAARKCCRILDELRMKGDLIGGVDIPSGGKLSVVADVINKTSMPAAFSTDKPDNRIISTCIALKDSRWARGENEPVILVTNDISLRVNASVCGVDVQSYRNDIIEPSDYTGHVEIETEPWIINRMYEGETGIDASLVGSGFVENEFVTLKGMQASALCIYRGGMIEKIKERRTFGNVKPRNSMQHYMLYALMAPVEEIPLVIITGPAGTAKTFLSLAAGLTDTYTGMGKRTERYNKVLISKPNVEARDNRGFGFLPGGLEEKMEPLLKSYYDNIEYLLRGEGKEEKEQISMQIEDMFETEAIEVCPLSYIRGRSLQNTFLICDEAQNASKRLIMDVITRAGDGTKVVICGDPFQVDNPTLDRKNNGLIFAAETMAGSKYAAILDVPEKYSTRSALAKEALIRMGGKT